MDSTFLAGDADANFDAECFATTDPDMMEQRRSWAGVHLNKSSIEWLRWKGDSMQAEAIS
jgi:hypothetical protein